MNLKKGFNLPGLGQTQPPTTWAASLPWAWQIGRHPNTFQTIHLRFGDIRPHQAFESFEGSSLTAWLHAVPDVQIPAIWCNYSLMSVSRPKGRDHLPRQV